MNLPPPPSERPLSANTAVTADDIYDAAQAIVKGTPPTSALAKIGIQPSHLAERLKTGDPFWAWAAACIDMAKAEIVSKAGRVVHDNLNDEDPKVRQRAAELILSRMSPDYAEKKSVSTDVTVTHQGGVDLAINLDRYLRDGKADIRSLTRPAPEVIDVSDPPALPAPVDEPADTTPAHHPAFARRPVRRDV